ncbi:MAG: OmpA family protein [Actinomycetota bacterium]
MSWTSEHEPSAPTHPGAAASAPAEPPGSDVGATGDDEFDPLGDEGPLDPSVFDGLFDDLGSATDEPAADNPLDEFLRAPLADAVDEAVATVDESGVIDGPAVTGESDDAGELDPFDLDELLLDTPTGDPADHRDGGDGPADGDAPPTDNDDELDARSFAIDDLFPDAGDPDPQHDEPQHDDPGHDGRGHDEPGHDGGVSAGDGDREATADGTAVAPAGDAFGQITVDPSDETTIARGPVPGEPEPLVLDPIDHGGEPGPVDDEPAATPLLDADRSATDERRWSDGSFATGNDHDPSAATGIPVTPPSEADRPVFPSALDVTPPPPLGPPPSEADQLRPPEAQPNPPSPWTAPAALTQPTTERPEPRREAPDDWYHDEPQRDDERSVVHWDRPAAEQTAPARFAPVGGPATGEPLTGESADGPFRASPPIQHDPEPELPLAAPVEPAPVEQPAVVVSRRKPGRVAVLALAVIIGSMAGVGGAIVLASLTGDDGDQLAAPVETASELTDDSEVAAPAGPVATGATVPEPAAIQTTTLNSLRFAADGASLAPSPSLALLAELIATKPDQPITATIRTYTETTAASDLARSADQAAALAAGLVELGADPAKVSVLGLGRSLLNPAQPVPNFVVPSAGLNTTPLSLVADEVGPFAIGLDRATGELRPESVAALDRLAQTMVADADGPHLTLAAYSFDLPTPEANDAQATAAATAASDHLAAAGVDAGRVRVVVAGDDSFAVPDRVANHIDLRWGTAADAELTLQSIDIDGIDFASGSADLDDATTGIVDELAAVIVASGAEAVIDVQSFDGFDTAAEVDLSVRRAQAIGQRLLAAGVPADRLRLHGGATPQFRAEDGNCRVVVTLIQPPTRS